MTKNHQQLQQIQVAHICQTNIQTCFLYACLVNAYGYLKGPQDMLQYYKGEYSEALETYALEQIGNRRRDEYQDGEVRANSTLNHHQVINRRK